MAEVIGKSVLIDKIAEDSGAEKKRIKEVLESFLHVVTEEVKADKEIRLIGFGTFKKAKRAARKGRSPQTGETIEIPASESLYFKSTVKY